MSREMVVPKAKAGQSVDVCEMVFAGNKTRKLMCVITELWCRAGLSLTRPEKVERHACWNMAAELMDAKTICSAKLACCEQDKRKI